MITIVTFSDHDWMRTATSGGTQDGEFTQVAVSRSETIKYRIAMSLPGSLFNFQILTF